MKLEIKSWMKMLLFSVSHVSNSIKVFLQLLGLNIQLYFDWWMDEFNLVSLNCRYHSSFLWIRFYYCNKVRWCFLGSPQARNFCGHYGLLFLWTTIVSRLKNCIIHGHCYPWGTFSNFSFSYVLKSSHLFVGCGCLMWFHNFLLFSPSIWLF